MKKGLMIISFVVLVLFLAGCAERIEIKIEPSGQPPLEMPEQPACNEDGKCDVTEDCDCVDCVETFECRKKMLEKDEYLLKRGMSEEVAGKTFTFIELDADGKATVSVDNVQMAIEKTKLREIVNMLEVTVLEPEYSLEPDKIIAKFLVKEYVPGPNEYLFESVGSEMIIESVRIRLSKVEYSTPKDFVRLDVGKAVSQKVRAGETEAIGGLSITLLEAHPKGTPKESYAILKVEKA